MTNPSRAEPFVGCQDGSPSANVASLSPRRKAGQGMEPAKLQGDYMTAARLPSRLCRSGKALHHNSLDQTTAAGICEPPGANRRRGSGGWALFRATISAMDSTLRWQALHDASSRALAAAAAPCIIGRPNEGFPVSGSFCTLARARAQKPGGPARPVPALKAVAERINAVPFAKSRASYP
jgi:hypothetical protein